MPLKQFLKRVLNESTDEDDDFAAVTEIYDDDDCPDDTWDDAIHAKMEAVKKVRVVRRGLPTAIARSTKPGYKIAHGEERKMSYAERRARERAAERTYQRKKKHMSDELQSRRRESINKRKDFGLEEE